MYPPMNMNTHMHTPRIRHKVIKETGWDVVIRSFTNMFEECKPTGFLINAWKVSSSSNETQNSQGSRSEIYCIFPVSFVTQRCLGFICHRALSSLRLFHEGDGCFHDGRRCHVLSTDKWRITCDLLPFKFPDLCLRTLPWVPHYYLPMVNRRWEERWGGKPVS